MPSQAMVQQRPEIHRLRSNSVPVAVSLMDCTAEEAGLIFSAAEKASARRRKHQSFDNSNLSPPSSRNRVPQLATPLYEDAEEDDLVHVPTPPSYEIPKTPTLGSEEDTPVVSPGVKEYNHDMVKFIQQRLQDMALGYYQPPTQRAPSEEEETEPNYTTSPQRPQLKSHFSNWSTNSTSSDGPDVAVDLVSSPPMMDSPMEDQDDKHIEIGYAHVVQFNQREDMGRASPSYFSWSSNKPKAAHASFNFETPLSKELRTPQSERKASSPLIDLDASQLDVNRASRGGFFFDLGIPENKHITPPPDVRQYNGPALHMGQHLPSPQPIRC